MLTSEDLNNINSTERSSIKTIEYKFNHPLSSVDKLVNLHKVRKQTFDDIVLVVSKALSEDLSQRYQNAQLFKQDLKAIIDIKPINARKPSYWYFLKKYVARNHAIAMVLIMSILTAFSALVFGVFQWNKTIQKNQEILASNQRLKTYSKFLNTTFKELA